MLGRLKGDRTLLACVGRVNLALALVVIEGLEINKGSSAIDPLLRFDQSYAQRNNQLP